MCQKCYRYWLDHTPPEQRGVAPRFVDDFWQLVEKTHEHGCWFWRGPTDRKGYGRWKNRHLAHREAWRREHGAIADGLFVLHYCDQHGCVNPKHLYLGTREQNAIDAAARGRVHSPRKDRCANGHLKEGDNLAVVQSGGYPSYRCRQCENERSNARQKAARQKRGLRTTRLTEDEKARVRELCAGGLSRRKVAALIGRSLSAVNRVMAEAKA
jgi:transposase-like protein